MIMQERVVQRTFQPQNSLDSCVDNSTVTDNCNEVNLASLNCCSVAIIFLERVQSLCGNYRIDPGDEGLENFGGCFTGEPDVCCNDNCTFKDEAVCR